MRRQSAALQPPKHSPWGHSASHQNRWGSDWRSQSWWAGLQAGAFHILLTALSGPDLGGWSFAARTRWPPGLGASAACCYTADGTAARASWEV